MRCRTCLGRTLPFSTRTNTDIDHCEETAVSDQHGPPDARSHRSQDILVSPGVYNGYSAKLMEKAGFKTACTTGAGLSNARLGVEDVGIMGLSDNVEACRMIARSVSIPVMADADTGYGTPATVYHTIQLFEAAGVAGVNIEDQVSPKRCGHMTGKDVVDPREMARKIEAACNASI